MSKFFYILTSALAIYSCSYGISPDKMNSSKDGYIKFENDSFVSTKALGTAIVRSRIANGSLNVPLDASNIYFTVSYATTDSNGVRCSWRGYI